MKNETLCVAVAIGGICVIEVAALLQGIDGVMLGLALSLVAGLGGFRVGRAYRAGKSK